MDIAKAKLKHRLYNHAIRGVKQFWVAQIYGHYKWMVRDTYQLNHRRVTLQNGPNLF